MLEVGQIEVVGTIFLQPHQLPHLRKPTGLAVGGKTHDLVFITIVGKA